MHLLLGAGGRPSATMLSDSIGGKNKSALAWEGEEKKKKTASVCKSACGHFRTERRKTNVKHNPWSKRQEANESDRSRESILERSQGASVTFLLFFEEKVKLYINIYIYGRLTSVRPDMRLKAVVVLVLLPTHSTDVRTCVATM